MTHTKDNSKAESGFGNTDPGIRASRKRIMIVEDEEVTALGIKATLEEIGYTVATSVGTGEEAVRKARECRPDLLLMDISLSGEMDGIEAAKQIQSFMNVPVLYLTAHSEEKIFQQAKNTNAFGYIVKPFDERELRIAVEMALYKHKTEEELRRYRDRLMELVEERTVELKNSNELLEKVFSSVHVLIAYMDTDFNFIKVNRRYAEADGRKPGFYVGKNHFDLFPNQENEAIFRRVAETGEPYFVKAKPFEYAYNPERGTTYWDWSLKPVTDDEGLVTGLVLSLIDVTDNIRLYSDLIRSEQLASIGRLAAGVAHEINNPINGIINYAQIIASKSERDSKEEDVAKRIIRESDRIAGIVSSLLSFARESRGRKSSVALSEILSEALALSELLLKKDGIKLDLKVPDDLVVFANKQQIEQVLLNMVSNAHYALNQKYPDDDENKILEISAEQILKDNVPYVRIIICDRGAGIPEELMDKLMSPFFTTKPVGKGTGLGLSISHGIVMDHNGRINIESREGNFTRVLIDLPAAAKI